MLIRHCKAACPAYEERAWTKTNPIRMYKYAYCTFYDKSCAEVPKKNCLIYGEDTTICGCDGCDGCLFKYSYRGQPELRREACRHMAKINFNSIHSKENMR